MNTPKNPPQEPSQPRRGNPDKLVPGLKPGQERGPDGKIRPKDPELSSESHGELAAMRWVATHPTADDYTWEQRSAREFKETSPAAFYQRKAKLEEGESAKPPGPGQPPTWDRTGPCPVCKVVSEPESPTDWQSDWALMDRVQRHRKRVVEWMDGEELK